MINKAFIASRNHLLDKQTNKYKNTINDNTVFIFLLVSRKLVYN